MFGGWCRADDSRSPAVWGDLVSMSSGVHVEEFTRTDSCDRCPYTGVVDCWYDPEIHTGGFDCPSCATPNDRSI